MRQGTFARAGIAAAVWLTGRFVCGSSRAGMAPSACQPLAPLVSASVSLPCLQLIHEVWGALAAPSHPYQDKLMQGTCVLLQLPCSRDLTEVWTEISKHRSSKPET